MRSKPASQVEWDDVPPVTHDVTSWEAVHVGHPQPVEEDDADHEGESLDHESWRPSGFAEWFAISQTLLPAALFLPGSQAYRLPLRAGAYCISIYAFLLWWFDKAGRREGHHPASRWLAFIFGLLVIEIAHPLTNSLFAGVAQVMLYFAIFSPLFWAPAYVASRQKLTRILAVLLICNGINSAVGVLQVYDPDRWMPRELSANFSQNRGALEASTYIGPGGRRIVRPPGLFDTPGAVCGAGTVAALFGLVLCLEKWAWWKRGLSLAMAVGGISAIYLSHVRASFVVTLGMMASYVAMLFLQEQKARSVRFVSLAVGLIMAGLSLATVLGGTSVQERFASLLEEDPGHLYYQSRGQQLEYAFGEMANNYPIGAGLARWGMMRSYFGDDRKLDSTELFAEIQPNAWILDGGLVLVGLYGMALLVTLVYDLRLIRSLVDPSDRLWASAVVAANLGTLALVFSFVPFGTATGMQYWFLEGALHGAMANRPRLS